LTWKTANTTTPSATSPFDGAANTAAMVTAGIANHPAAEFCKNLSIGGFTDWYLPSYLELAIAFFNLKPDTSNNNTSFGVNNYSVPKRSTNYTLAYPAQTYVTVFNTVAEAFTANEHWASTESASDGAYSVSFNTGAQNLRFKTSNQCVRAFRRIAL